MLLFAKNLYLACSTFLKLNRHKKKITSQHKPLKIFLVMKTFSITVTVNWNNIDTNARLTLRSALHRSAACRPGGPWERPCHEARRCAPAGLRPASATSPGACVIHPDQPIPAHSDVHVQGYIRSSVLSVDNIHIPIHSRFLNQQDTRTRTAASFVHRDILSSWVVSSAIFVVSYRFPQFFSRTIHLELNQQIW